MEALHEIETEGTAQLVQTRVPNQFVTFTCGDRAFGIDIMCVREIRSWSPTTELPAQPFGAKGVLDIRGSIVQVYDLESMLGGMGGGGQSGQVVLVVSLRNQDVGLMVDTVSDIIFAQPDDLRPVPATKGGHGAGPVSGLVKNEDRLIAILDLSALFPGESGDTFM
jgi:purine-binding chemotaxis protein CheW